MATGGTSDEGGATGCGALDGARAALVAGAEVVGGGALGVGADLAGMAVDLAVAWAVDLLVAEASTAIAASLSVPVLAVPGTDDGARGGLGASGSSRLVEIA